MKQYVMENPVFVKEMRVGFREKKVFFALTAWVIIVALFASISSAAALAETNSISDLPTAGKALFEMLFWVQLVLLAMLAPSLTTSAVSGERERQSFEMLLTTHLAPSELIFGKFGFAASFIVLSLFSTIPLEAIVFFLGGVSLASFFYAKLILLTFGLLASLLGLMLSARETRSAYATGQTYFCLLILSFTVLPFLGMLRYAPDVPLVAYILCVLSALYLLLFLFWKSVNHLEERADHLKKLLTIGLVFYIILVATALSTDEIWGELNRSIWALYAPVQYLLMGIMLNPIRPERLRERMLFAKSPLSNPIYWMLLLALGTLLPNVYAEDFSSTVMSFYTLLAGLGTGLFARGLSLRKPARFPFVLGFSWLLLNVLPAFTAITGVSGDERIYHPSMISPFCYLISSYDSSWQEAPLTAFAFYAALAVVGLVIGSRWERQARAAVPAAPPPEANTPVSS
jgi:ABC-type transport system involved in multi-copper enzyme maturation permease subunit